MASEIGMRIATTLQPIYDIVLPSTPTVRAADVAPAAGLDVAVVGGIAVIVAAALAFIVHKRRKP